ncbi:uncharacterized protein LOC111108839 [Crassostrea virginica]
MDPDYSAQDVARCDLCKTAIAQSYCDFCHVNLCKPCIGDHISDEYDKHKIVPFQQRKSTLIYPKCTSHQNEACKHQCKECNECVCPFCIASKQHQGHEFLNLEELFNIKREIIHRDTEELENKILPNYEEISKDLENKIANLDGQYKKLTTDISNQREEFHKEIDAIFDKVELEMIGIKEQHSSILKRQLDEVKDTQSSIGQTLTTLNEMERANEIIWVIHYASKNKEFIKFPQVSVSMPTFIPKKMAREELHSAIGELTPLSTTLEERIFTAKKPNTSVRELLDEPELLETINTGYKKLCNVAYFDDEGIWTSGDTGIIRCFNIQGVPQKTINTKGNDWPRDLVGDKNGALLYSEWLSRTVNKVQNDQTEVIITLQGWHPLNLCVSTSGDLLVTMHSDDKSKAKVVRYSGSTVKQTIQFDDEGQSLYSGNSFFKYISENRNLDICVADWKAGAVVVVNQAGQLRFRYTGHPSPTKNMPFEPRGITTDSQSCILTVSGKNHCIHILDTDGQFLRYIDNCDLKDLWGLCVDSIDSLFVCEYYTGNVKKIKYLK